MKNKIDETYSRLVGLVSGLADAPSKFIILIAVDGDGQAVVHEVDNVLVNARAGQVVWFTKGLEKYTKIENALRTWGVQDPLEDWLNQKLEKVTAQNETYVTGNHALRTIVDRLEHKVSRQRDEIERLQKLMDKLSEKQYDNVSHG